MFVTNVLSPRDLAQCYHGNQMTVRSGLSDTPIHNIDRRTPTCTPYVTTGIGSLLRVHTSSLSEKWLCRFSTQSALILKVAVPRKRIQ